jgi:prepilin-type N-terminal cleavage/methylation domain-containing protein
MAIKKAFSLIELLVVVALIGILTAIAVASYSTMQKKARDNRKIADMKAIQNAMEQSYADKSVYPTGSGCPVDTTYLPNGYPLNPKTGTVYGNISCPDGITYCACALMEIENGNSGNSTCSYGTGTSYYCVSQRQ